MKKISFVFGTRPEAIKLCPLVVAMKERNSDMQAHVCVTGQHREMLRQVLEVFDVAADRDLDLMQDDQTPAQFCSCAIQAIDEVLAADRPDMVVVQGDTTTVFCAALSAFYRQIPVAHVEAGLRTWNPRSPFPEELHRVMTTRLANYHFAPTEWARQNLLDEGVAEELIAVTGNTVIDALHLAAARVRATPPVIDDIPQLLQPGTSMEAPPMVLITGHRRENCGEGIERVCCAIDALATRHVDVHFVYAVHANPRVQAPVQRILAARRRENIHLIAPLDYLAFVGMMERSTLILTDSGGVQEEAPSLGKPVLLLRDTTERPEAVDSGTVRLVGTDADRIVEAVSELLTDRTAYDKMANIANPYGDGKSCERILAFLERNLEPAFQLNNSH